MIYQNIQKNENISAYYDNELNISQRLRLEAILCDSIYLSKKYTNTLYEYYLISKSFNKIKRKFNQR